MGSLRAVCIVLLGASSVLVGCTFEPAVSTPGAAGGELPGDDLNSPDAGEVTGGACTLDSDCTGGSPCTDSAACVNSVCIYTMKTCAEFSDDCNAGVCNEDTGQCGAAPVNDGGDCNGGTACVGVGECNYENAACSYSGTQATECSTQTCSAGMCVEGELFAGDAQECGIRETDGVPCGEPDCRGGACGNFYGFCDSSGSRSVSCTTPACGGGTCSQVSASETTEACYRESRNGEDCRFFGENGTCFGDYCIP